MGLSSWIGNPPGTSTASKPHDDEIQLQLQPPRPLTADSNLSSPNHSTSNLSTSQLSNAESGLVIPEKSEEAHHHHLPPRRRSNIGEYFLSEVDPKWTDLPLIVCCFVGGLVDALSYNYWGNFCNMQTGNAIFIALGVAGKPIEPDMLWAKALTAILAFLTGSIIYTHASHLLGATRRLTLILSFALQTATLLGAALAVQVVNPKPADNQTILEWRKGIAIALLSFQASGQIAASRFLACPEIPTVLLTALACDLFLDANLYQRPWSSNPKRNRRIGALLAHFLGAMTAGGMAKNVGLAGGLWLAMALKAGITMAWFGWSGKKNEDYGESGRKR